VKLRIQGDSLRLRVGPGEIARLLESGRIEERVHFAAEPEARLTYALELGGAAFNGDGSAVSVRWRPQEVAVVIPREMARAWAASEQVGMSGETDAGEAKLAVLIEKDFACLEQKAGESEDTFPNPKAGATC
jgi:hypothetical protein